MLYALSTSVLFLVAGSTVRASPIFGFKEVNPIQSVISSASSTSQLASSLTLGLAIPTSTASHITTKHTTTSTLSGHPTTTNAATITGAKGGAASTFTVPISTPTGSAKTSIAVHSGTHSATASAKATVRPTAGSSNNNGTSLAPGSSCDGTNDGAVVCSADGTLFGLCDFGEAVMRPVSKGTACRNGAIDYIADTLGVALGQVKSYLDASDNTTSVFGAADPKAVDASDCPSALLYLKDMVDAADTTAESSSTALRFVNTNGKTVVDNSDIELVLKPDGTAGFQVTHQCGGSGSSKSRRQLWIEICLL